LRLLVDENLPPRLIRDLADLFPDSSHVSLIGLSSSADAKIWEQAKTHAFTFLTKDKDFANLSIAWGAPPKVILLQMGNCSTDGLIRILRNNAIRLSDFESDAKRSLLVLR
jgi:predicted nuclease of predicted toxin-antitoxin system